MNKNKIANKVRNNIYFKQLFIFLKKYLTNKILKIIEN